MNKIMEKGKVKGSILFTVITVMMVLVVFLMSTLVLTSSANRRSYYTYFETQAQYAAQAALDAVTNSAYTDGDFYDWVVKASKAYKADTSDSKTKPRVTVNFTGSNIQFSNDVNAVTCEVELADETLVWDELTGAVHKTPAYKVTATASVGNGKNRSDYTVVNYIYENYRIDDPDKLPSVSNNAQNKLYSWTRRNGGEIKNLTPNVPKAVYSFGKSATSNNMQYFGPQYSGMSTIPAGRGLYNMIEQTDKQFFTALSNDNHSVGNAVFVSNVKSAVLSNYIFQDYGEHAIFYGNLYPSQPGKGFYFKADISNATKTQNGGVSYGQTPYVYVDGVIDTYDNNGSVFIGYDDDMNEGNTNVNLYCGGIKIGDGNSGSLVARGDIYMYDPDVDSVWGGSTGNQDLTRLGYFVDNNVGGLNAKWGLSNAGGNIFCNNSSLSLNVGMTIPGDLVMTNNTGKLIVNAGITVYGKVICAGTIEGLENLTCDTIVTSTSAKVDGIEYNLDSVTDPNLQVYKKDTDEDGIEDTFDYAAFLYETYGDKGFYGTYINTNDETVYIPNSADADANWEEYKKDAYQQALMPYNMRQDEIVDTFYRWDLKATSEAAVQEKMTGDKMIAESIHTGHIYGIKKFDCGGYVAPVTGTEMKTVYQFDSVAQDIQRAHNEDPSKYPEYQEYNWNETQGLPGGEGKWFAVSYTTEANIYGEPTWVEDYIYVPYTTSRSSSDFMPTFTPITNDKEILAALADSMITDIGTFTSNMGGVKKLTCGSKAGYTKITEAGLTRTNVPIGYHSTNEGNEFITNGTMLNNAFVIKESCYIDLGGAADASGALANFFVDPTGHDASDPIKIVLSGRSQCCGLFVINNTSYYSTDYNNIVASYAERNVIAPKGAVQFFFEDGFYPTNLFQIHNSGLFPYSNTAGTYSGASGAFHIVSNPLYPWDKDGNDVAEWASLPSAIKYSYEYVPMAMIYGEAGAEYNSQNGEVLNAVVSMPKSIFNATNANQYKADVTYQEYWYSSSYHKDNYPSFGIGSVVCEDITTGPNVASVVYIGDANNSGAPQIIEGNKDTTQNSGKLGNENTDYFSNDHIGAS
ncbi:MAG: hypothetical protein MJ065_02625 [Oscillospiraceae bacterium]|nr:hypothetical protein [Oscillospiraceae bacterium]